VSWAGMGMESQQLSSGVLWESSSRDCSRGDSANSLCYAALMSCPDIPWLVGLRTPSYIYAA